MCTLVFGISVLVCFCFIVFVLFYFHVMFVVCKVECFLCLFVVADVSFCLFCFVFVCLFFVVLFG